MILHVPPESPALIHYGAATILAAHIGGGVGGMAGGAAALALPKGSQAHRLAGAAFVVSMTVMAGVGAAVAPFLPTPDLSSTAAGVFTLYMVTTGWGAAKRRPGAIGVFEVGAFLTALAVAGAMAALAWTGAHNPGAVAGPWQAVAAFGAVLAAAAGLDLKVILAGGIAGPARLARHLWRLCLGLFVAAASFFLGQQAVMPSFVRGSPLLLVPALAPLAMMIFWLVRVRATNRRRLGARSASLAPAA